MNEADRRKHARIFLTVAVTLQVDGKVIRGTESRNISISGMFVATEVYVEKGSKGTISLSKKCGNDIISFTATFEVVRSGYLKESGGGYGVGLNFLEIDPAYIQNLQKIVAFQSSLAA